MTDTLIDQFADRGYALEPGLFSKRQCAQVLRAWRRADAPPADWIKGHAVTNRAVFDVAAHRAIVDRAVELIGEDVMLWGVTLLERKPGEVHPWHTDLETSSPEGRTVSVWIGLDGVNENSSLHLIAGSHRLGRTVQQISRENGVGRGEADEHRLLEWAKQIDPACALLHPDMSDGDAIWFDGRIWHGSCNTNARRTRWAMLVQFAAPDTPIRIPNFSRFDGVDRFRDWPLPPCILVSGGSDHGRGCANRIVPPPARGVEPQLGCRIHSFDLPRITDDDAGRAQDIAFVGGTPLLRFMSCHASLLAPDRVPHPPHVHDEEEVLLVFEGELDLVLVDDGEGKPVEHRHRIKPGQFVYYPVSRRHTLHNPGDVPAMYAMFKWKSHSVDGRNELGTELIDYSPRDDDAPPNERGMSARLLLHGGTDQLRWIHSHVTTIRPGGGYEPHADAYDVALVTLEGEIETLGRRVPPRSVVYYPAGELHGVRNVGDSPARYLVFEFHASMSPGIARSFPALRRRLRPLKQTVRRMIRR